MGKRKKQKVIRIKKAGWLYSLVCIILGIAGINTGNNLVYMIDAAMLGFMGISGFFGVRNLKNISAEVYMSKEAFAGTTVPVRVVVKNNRSFFPAFLIRVNIDGFEASVPYVECKSETEIFLDMNYPARGVYQLEEGHISSVYPFNFFVRYKPIPVSGEIVVYPSPIKCEYGAKSADGNIKGEEETDKEGYGASPISVKEYTPGDPIKYLHWKAIARTGKMITKVMSDESAKPVILDFKEIPSKELETKLGCAAFLIINLFRSGQPVGLYIGKKHFEPSTDMNARNKMLKELAVYDKS